MPYKFKLLAIDGGGIRGIIPAKILSKIEKDTGKSISELFNLIAGTSTGGILSLGLTKPNSTHDNQNEPDSSRKPRYTAKELVNLYRERGAEIFYEPPLERFTDVDDIIRPKYSSEGRDKVLKEYFGDTPIEDALTEVFITSYDIELRNPIFFTSNPNKQVTESKVFRKICSGFKMNQAGMATSAAPTYFEPYRIKTSQTPSGYYTLVDGGVFANNPASLALMETIIDFKKAKKRIALEDILVVSLGTGSLTHEYTYEQAKNWGLLGWVRPLLNITLDGSSESVSVQLEQLLPHATDRPPQYYRFQPFLSSRNEAMDIATPENIDELEEIADLLIAESSQKRWDELYEQLCEPLAPADS